MTVGHGTLTDSGQISLRSSGKVIEMMNILEFHRQLVTVERVICDESHPV